MILLGLHSATTTLPINEAISKELCLQCSYAYTQSDFETASELLANKALPYQHWVSEMPLAEGQSAFETLVNKPDTATKIILLPHASA